MHFLENPDKENNVPVSRVVRVHKRSDTMRMDELTCDKTALPWRRGTKGESSTHLFKHFM